MKNKPTPGAKKYAKKIERNIERNKNRKPIRTWKY